MTERIYSMEESRNLLGALLNNPKILLSNKYDITREDFKPCEAHYRLMAVIENLVANGSSEIDTMQIEQFIEPYEEIKEVFKDNRTIAFVNTIKKLINPDNIELYYNKVKKLTALRDYRDSGYDITELFDERKDQIKEINKIEKVKLEDIVKYFDIKNTELRKKYNKKDASISYVPETERLKKVIMSFKENPLQGACLQSPYLSTISNGALRGSLFLRSGNSGSGKTTITIGDMCELCATKLYNIEKECWEVNLNRQGGGLHIHTESNPETAVSMIYLAYIANVERSKIKHGTMTQEEEERVMRATEIFEESGIYLEYHPKFDIPSLREMIKHYKDKYDIFGVFFDYIAINGVFNVRLIQEMKNYIPDHQALLQLSEELKLIAEEEDVFIESGTQCNDQVKLLDFCDESCLSASKAIKNKIDFGCISTYLKSKEKKQIEPFLERKGFKEHLRPNRCIHVYKGRENSIGYDKIKVFQHVFLGTGRTIDMFCTDENNELISINRTQKIVE